MPPSGSSTDAAQAFYNYLYGQYFHMMPVDRTQILWQNPVRIAVWFVVLSGLLFLAARYAVRVHRKRNEIYGATSFAGNILERNGKIAIASWVIWIVITGWALFFIISHALYGQVY